MEPESKFATGYYQINGIPDNRSNDWYLLPSEIADNDRFLWLPGQYETPLHQAQIHALHATRRETRRDAVLTLSIAPGEIYMDWRVVIDEEKCGIIVSGNCEFVGFHAVEYLGPPEMHSYTYRRQRESTELYRDLYRQAEKLCNSGDLRFRRSRRSGLVMYNGCWPRYHSDGRWWEGAHENSYLSFDDDADLLEQWEFIFDYEEWKKKYRDNHEKRGCETAQNRSAHRSC